MHYKTSKLAESFNKLEGVEPFLKELGLPVEKMDKLTVGKNDIGEDQKVVVLSTP
jgi:hypothetical protein